MALPFYSNWSTSRPPPHHAAAAAVPPPQTPPELSPFHNNFTFSDHQIFNNNNLSFNNNNIKYPSLSSSFDPITTQQQQYFLNNPPLIPDNNYNLTPFTSFTNDQWEYSPFIHNEYDHIHNEYDHIHNECDHIHSQFFPMNSMEVSPMMMPEIYPYNYDNIGGEGNGGHVNMEVEERSYNNYVGVKKDNGGGGKSLSVQSMAARVRRRKISQKTLELGKLIPGGQRMTTAEMFQAAAKYVKFLQAQVGVLQLINDSCSGPSEELEALVTSASVQEKLYSAEKCIVTQTLIHDHHQE